MATIFMNSKNSLTSDPHRPLLNIADKMNLMRSDRYVALKKYNTKKPYKNNKFKIPALTWNEKFELHDGSYSVRYLRLF